MARAIEKGATYLDKLCHKLYDEPKGRGFQVDGKCRHCGSPLMTYYCEDRLHLVACEKCGTLALTKAVAPQVASNLTLRQPTLPPQNEPMTLEFDVVDTTTGKYPDWERIAREEAWAKGLVYCDMDGIAIREDGSLILLDECGNCVSCPPDRFEIRRPPEGEEDT